MARDRTTAPLTPASTAPPGAPPLDAAYADMPGFRWLERPAPLPPLAYAHTPGAGAGAALPTVVFLPGYASDMTGAKATHLAACARERGQGFVRLDYSGTGASGGAFADGTLGAWLADARDVIAAAAPAGPLLLVGSSMGGWLALRLALLEPRVRAVLGIAPAPDFHRWGVLDALTDAQRAALARDGVHRDGVQTYTKRLLDEGDAHILLGRAHDLAIPITIVQGRADAVVPWRTALRIEAAFPRADVRLVFVEDGDHRLSRPGDLDILAREMARASGV
jgi:pimeloyl-ACP methyl ester carboxylesterase